MDEPKTPEHDKAKEFASEMQSIGNFLEWLPTQDLHVCQRDANFGKYYPVPLTDLLINQLLAKFYGIDFKAYQAEKEAVYQYVSQLAKEK